MRTSRKRATSSPITITPDARAILAGEAHGLVVMQYFHDADCVAGRTQRLDDCTCQPDVEVVSYRDPEAAGGAR